MSRIGKKPIPLPDGVKAEVAGKTIKVTGPLGTLSWNLPGDITAEVDEAAHQVHISRPNDQKKSRGLHGLSRALINNMAIGVSKGYQKRLLIYGTGYNCRQHGDKLHLNVGFGGRAEAGQAAQFIIDVPEGIKLDIETPAARGDTEPAKMVVKGIDKQLVGEFTAEVRAIRPPEPYKGKGIRYEDEHVVRKQGKAFASAG